MVRQSAGARAVRCSGAALLVVAGLASVTHGAPRRRVTLPELIRLAQRSPAVRMARGAAVTARARASEVKAARYVRLELTSFLGPSPKIDCDNPDCTRTSPTDAGFTFDGAFGGASLTAVQPLFGFGKFDDAKGAADAGARAAAHLELAASGDVTVQAAQAYYGLKLARELGWMLADGKTEVDAALVSVAESLDKGSSDVSVQDKLRVETLRAEIEARLTEADEAAAKALAGITALTGETSIDIDEEPLETVEFALAESAAAYLPGAHVGRPELNAARAGADAARRLVDFERARFWPDLALVGSVSAAAAGGVDDPPSAFASDPYNKAGAALGLVLRWTLDPFAQVAKVKRVRAEARQAEELVGAVTTLTDFEVRQAFAAAAEAKKRIAAARAGEKSARAWVASVLQADAIGLADSRDRADAYIAYFTLRTRTLSAIHDYNLATFRLRRAGAVNAAAEGRVEGP